MVAGNYKVACDLLKERFARPALIIFAHVDRLLKLGARDHKDLKSIQDELLLHVRSLERLGIGGDTYGVILTPLVLSRLPEAFRMEWARDCAGRESDLDYLLESLKREIERKERSKVVAGGGGSAQEARPPQGRRAGHTSSASALHTSSRPSTRSSSTRSSSSRPSSEWSPGLCNGSKPHQTAKCDSLNNLSIPERMNKIKYSSLCFACLERGHRARQCSSRCSLCQGRHYLVCCPHQGRESSDPSRGDSAAAVELPPQSSVAVSLPCGGSSQGRGAAALGCGAGGREQTRQLTVLPTAKVLVYGAKGVVEATALFDSGSDRTYVTDSLVEQVGPKFSSSQVVSFAAFGGGKLCNGTKNVYKMSVKGVSVPGGEVKVYSCCCTSDLCPPVPSQCVGRVSSGLSWSDTGR